MTGTPAYQAADAAHARAYAAFQPVRDQFRAGKVDSAAFLAARDAYQRTLDAWENVRAIEFPGR